VEKLLGKDYVIPLLSDQAIATYLGSSRSRAATRTLDEYLDDLNQAASPQTDERCAEVRSR
jgi:hypothetical protein